MTCLSNICVWMTPMISLIGSYVVVPDEESLCERFVNASNPDDAGDALNQLLKASRSSQGDIEDLQSCDVPSIAVHAAWIENARTVPQKSKTRRTGWFGSPSPRPLKVAGVQRFIGFVEGRLNVSVPKWWEKMIASPDKQHVTRLGFVLPKWRFLEFTDEEFVTLRSSIYPEKQFVAPVEELKWLRSKKPYICIEAPDGVIVLSDPAHTNISGLIGEFPRLGYLSKSAHKTRWHKDLWLPSFRSTPTGIGEDDIVLSIKVTESTVTVFGAHMIKVAGSEGSSYSDPVFFLEQLSLSDGKLLCRFSSDLWGNVDEELGFTDWQ